MLVCVGHFGFKLKIPLNIVYVYLQYQLLLLRRAYKDVYAIY